MHPRKLLGGQNFPELLEATQSGLSLDLTFNYFDHELNLIPEAWLHLFDSDNDPAGPWAAVPATNADATANTLSTTGAGASLWMLGASPCW